MCPPEKKYIRLMHAEVDFHRRFNGYKNMFKEARDNYSSYLSRLKPLGTQFYTESPTFTSVPGRGQLYRRNEVYRDPYDDLAFSSCYFRRQLQNSSSYDPRIDSRISDKHVGLHSTTTVHQEKIGQQCRKSCSSGSHSQNNAIGWQLPFAVAQNGNGHRGTTPSKINFQDNRVSPTPRNIHAPTTLKDRNGLPRRERLAPATKHENDELPTEQFKYQMSEPSPNEGHNQRYMPSTSENYDYDRDVKIGTSSVVAVATTKDDSYKSSSREVLNAGTSNEVFFNERQSSSAGNQGINVGPSQTRSGSDHYDLKYESPREHAPAATRQKLNSEDSMVIKSRHEPSVHGLKRKYSVPRVRQRPIELEEPDDIRQPQMQSDTVLTETINKTVVTDENEPAASSFHQFERPIRNKTQRRLSPEAATLHPANANISNAGKTNSDDTDAAETSDEPGRGYKYTNSRAWRKRNDRVPEKAKQFINSNEGRWAIGPTNSEQTAGSEGPGSNNNGHNEIPQTETMNEIVPVRHDFEIFEEPNESEQQANVSVYSPGSVGTPAPTRHVLPNTGSSIFTNSAPVENSEKLASSKAVYFTVSKDAEPQHQPMAQKTSTESRNLEVGDTPSSVVTPTQNFDPVKEDSETMQITFIDESRQLSQLPQPDSALKAETIPTKVPMKENKGIQLPIRILKDSESNTPIPLQKGSPGRHYDSNQLNTSDYNQKILAKPSRLNEDETMNLASHVDQRTAAPNLDSGTSGDRSTNFLTTTTHSYDLGNLQNLTSNPESQSLNGGHNQVATVSQIPTFRRSQSQTTRDGHHLTKSEVPKLPFSGASPLHQEFKQPFSYGTSRTSMTRDIVRASTPMLQPSAPNHVSVQVGPELNQPSNLPGEQTSTLESCHDSSPCNQASGVQIVVENKGMQPLHAGTKKYSLSERLKEEMQNELARKLTEALIADKLQPIRNAKKASRDGIGNTLECPDETSDHASSVTSADFNPPSSFTQTEEDSESKSLRNAQKSKDKPIPTGTQGDPKIKAARQIPFPEALAGNKSKPVRSTQMVEKRSLAQRADLKKSTPIRQNTILPRTSKYIPKSASSISFRVPRSQKTEVPKLSCARSNLNTDSRVKQNPKNGNGPGSSAQPGKSTLKRQAPIANSEKQNSNVSKQFSKTSGKSLQKYKWVRVPEFATESLGFDPSSSSEVGGSRRSAKESISPYRKTRAPSPKNGRGPQACMIPPSLLDPTALMALTQSLEHMRTNCSNNREFQELYRLLRVYLLDNEPPTLPYRSPSSSISGRGQQRPTQSLSIISEPSAAICNASPWNTAYNDSNTCQVTWADTENGRINCGERDSCAWSGSEACNRTYSCPGISVWSQTETDIGRGSLKLQQLMARLQNEAKFCEKSGLNLPTSEEKKEPTNTLEALTNFALGTASNVDMNSDSNENPEQVLTDFEEIISTSEVQSLAGDDDLDLNDRNNLHALQFTASTMLSRDITDELHERCRQFSN